MLTMRATAEFLGKSHKTVQANWKTWGLPGIRIGKCIMFRERELETWLDQHRAA
jgi:predicted DNA-binding transcriptional regulator AlpA